MNWKLFTWILMNYLWSACIGDPWVGKEPGKILVLEKMNATFIWNYTGSEVSIKQITWTFQDTNVNILTYIPPQEYPNVDYKGRVGYEKTLGNAALLLSSVSANDSGVYSVSLSTEGPFYESQNSELKVVTNEAVQTCFEKFTMTIEEKNISTSGEKITITATSGEGKTIEMYIPDGCNNEAICSYRGTECGHCRLNTNCKFEVKKVEPGTAIAVTVIPCQGLEIFYNIELLAAETTEAPPADEKTPLSTGAKAGIGAAVACITVIVISSVIYVLKKKQTR